MKKQLLKLAGALGGVCLAYSFFPLPIPSLFFFGEIPFPTKEEN